jgi:diguanylate cyclase (GGDEF)-like protein
VLLVVFHHKRQQALTRLADERLYDPLTGLGQRGVFQMRLDAALARRRRHDRPLAVLYCDLNEFKAINDQHGHNAGDKLLAAVAKRITAAVRDTDMPARLGGDEFAVICEEASLAETQEIAERIRTAVAAPLTLHGRELQPKISVGGAVVVTGDARGDELLHEADLAMYHAKRSGQGCKIVVTSGSNPTPPVPAPRASTDAPTSRQRVRR